MTPEEARELPELGERGRECLAWRADAGSPAGVARAARLESLPVAEAADVIRPCFALVATEDLAGEIAGDLRLDPEKAERIAREIQAARRRLEHATRPFRPIAAED
jgi:hypothetical protein